MSIRTTRPLRGALIARLAAGAPLAFFGMMKFLSPGVRTNFHATLVLAGFPAPDILMYVAATVEVVGGILLLTGWFARVGGALAAVHMLIALFVHLTVDFREAPAGGPPHWLPVMVLVAAVTVLRLGGGIWSLDFIATRSEPS